MYQPVFLFIYHQQSNPISFVYEIYYLAVQVEAIVVDEGENELVVFFFL